MKEVVIVNKRGIHARAAAKITRLINQYDAIVNITCGQNEVIASSLMGLLTLGASMGKKIEINATGKQANDATSALLSLIQTGFDEDITYQDQG